ncbi:MAG: sigma-70 family RNA polymerase sigma factor [Gammaproteobacteria bacterium]|nr:sigma-70 family RNA polymerase sigma factor [Gammaproteobacteria bacterium]
MDDNTLLARYINGDDAALTCIVKRYQKDIYCFVYRQVGNEADAADITQKVFINLFLKARQFEGKSSFKSWLYQIAINQCKNQYRSNDRRREHGVDESAEEFIYEDNKFDDVFVMEKRRILQDAINNLPSKQRLTMQLRVYQECSFAEIAEIMASSIGTVKASYHQAVISLTKSLKEEAYEPAQM